jgi:anaerobic selenocysteine-containing dehydrogenase
LPQGEKPNGAFIPVARICDLLLSPGTPFTYEGREHVYPDTRLLYWVGGNPFHHHQDLARLERAWAVPETIIVQEIVWSPTAKRADIVLPATTSLERNDIAGSRRSDYIMAMRKAVEPMAQSRPDYEIVRELAARLGVTQAFTEGLDEMGWIRRMYGEVRTDAANRFAFDMPDFEAFWELGATPVPARKNFTYLGDYRQNPAAHPPQDGERTNRVGEQIAGLAQLCGLPCACDLDGAAGMAGIGQNQPIPVPSRLGATLRAPAQSARLQPAQPHWQGRRTRSGDAQSGRCRARRREVRRYRHADE